MEKMEDARLACEGGAPVRAEKKLALPVVPEAALHEVIELLQSGRLAIFYGGSQVRRFEKTFADRFGRAHAVGVNSGTSALHVALIAARLPEHSEVLVPVNAYISAVSALLQAHLVPVFVDVDPVHWAMDPVDAERKVTDNTSAMIPVHMYGQPCPMAELMKLATKHHLFVLEDCGQAHGAVIDGQQVGSFGDVAAYSLCCRKHIAMGEGGIVTTNRQDIADSCRALAHKGKGMGWFDYRELGFSYNMMEVQGVLGLHQLLALDKQLKTRSDLAAYLRQALADLGLGFPEVRPGSTHVYFKQNAVIPQELKPLRNEIVDAIRAENVGCDPSHPHLLDVDWIRNKQDYAFRQAMPDSLEPYTYEDTAVGKDILDRQICIEVGPGLTLEDVQYTAKAIRKVVSHYMVRQAEQCR